MGTRSLICIFYKGRFMVAQYTQFDGYIEGQGWAILEFLLVPGNIERLKAGMEFVTIVDEETVKELFKGHGYSTWRSGQQVCECGAPHPLTGPGTCIPPTLSRMTGADILKLIASARSDSYLPVYLQLEFANDGLFCEYAYCVDLDNNVFEAFGGSVEKPKRTSNDGPLVGRYRFADVGAENDNIPRLLASFPFDHLPKDLKDMEAQIKDKNPGFYIMDDEIDTLNEKGEEDEKDEDKKSEKEEEDEEKQDAPEAAQ